MTLRTAEDLNRLLSDELAWRKKELHTILTLVRKADLPTGSHVVLIRSGIALLYAHWEGFIKVASQAYLEFVSMQKMRHDQLAANFLALSARSLFHKSEQSDKIRAHMEVVRFFTERMADRSSIPVRQGINTKSNLSSEVLRDIVDTLGLDYVEYEAKAKLIDERLVKARNGIAHGNYLSIDRPAFEDLYHEILSMMDMFSNQIENAVALKTYARP